MSEPSRPAADPSSRLAAAREAFVTLRPRIAAGEPWPLAADFGIGPEASWGPREVLAHTAEMLSFWLGEYERIVEAGRASGNGVPFGRVSSDPVRLGILERDRSLPVRELSERIDVGIRRWEGRLAEGTPGEGSLVGLHPRLGELTADVLLERFVLDHLEEHVAQMERVLGPG